MVIKDPKFGTEFQLAHIVNLHDLPEPDALKQLKDMGMCFEVSLSDSGRYIVGGIEFQRIEEEDSEFCRVRRGTIHEMGTKIYYDVEADYCFYLDLGGVYRSPLAYESFGVWPQSVINLYNWKTKARLAYMLYETRDRMHDDKA